MLNFKMHIIPYLLNMQPSVVTTSDAGAGVGYTGIRIRGTDGTRINTTINGIPLNDAESQISYFVDVPDLLSSVDNIQIQRGVGTSTNGAGAFGGSINIETTKLNVEPYAAISSSFGSFNTYKNTINIGATQKVWVLGGDERGTGVANGVWKVTKREMGWSNGEEGDGGLGVYNTLRL